MGKQFGRKITMNSELTGTDFESNQLSKKTEKENEK